MSLEQIRPILLIALAFVLFLMWQAWQQDYGVKPALVPDSATTAEQAPASPDIPDVPVAPQGTEGSTTTDVPKTEASPQKAAQTVRVRTDLLDLEIGLEGGGLLQLSLLKYPVAIDKPDVSFELLKDSLPNFFILQSGLLGDFAAPNHHAQFVADRDEFVLEEGQDTLEVNLHWADEGDVRVTKVYTFHRNSYAIDVMYEIENQGSEPWSGRMYGQLQRTEDEQKRGIGFIYTYTGGVISSEEKPYQKIDFGDMANENLDENIKGGWVAMIQHYFASAWVPEQTALNHYYSKALQQGRYVLGLITPPISISGGQSDTLKLVAYVGPKIQDRMEEVAPGLSRTVDYGWLFFIAQPVFWLLHFIHNLVGNWGWSIIIVTMIIKLAFFHLSATSYKSMARMRKLQPRMTAIRERYAGDKQRMNQAMMEMYKKDKINPLGGCLPIVVQIPVFISLYWVLLESVELRQAPFIFWLNDLSTHDPYFVLPILMGVTMLAQQKLNPAPPDPIQAKIMMALPFVFTFFFLFFPSGLVLYWFVNNLLSIAQQWVITRKIIGSQT